MLDAGNAPSPTAGSTEKTGDSVVSVIIDGGAAAYYDTIDEAWTATNGKTAVITLLTDTTVSNQLRMESGSGKITLKSTASTAIWIENGEFNFFGGTVDSDGACLCLVNATFNMIASTLKRSSTLVNVQGGNTITIEDGTLTGKFYVMENSSLVSLSGGTYSWILVAGQTPKYGDLLAEGYYYYKNNKPIEPPDSNSTDLKNVIVKVCKHKGVTGTPIDDDGSGWHKHTLSQACTYCDAAVGTQGNCTFAVDDNLPTATQHIMQCSSCSNRYDENHTFGEWDSGTLARTCSVCTYRQSAVAGVEIYGAAAY